MKPLFAASALALLIAAAAQAGPLNVPATQKAIGAQDILVQVCEISMAQMFQISRLQLICHVEDGPEHVRKRIVLHETGILKHANHEGFLLHKELGHCS